MSSVPPSPKPLVFISYSRRDSDFLKRLVPALERRGIEPRFDEHDLPTLEDWRRELLHIIRQADAVIVVLSSNSVSSPVCYWEVSEASLLKKRLAPLALMAVDDHAVPEAVRSINYLDFSSAADFEPCVDRLAQALLSDIGWVKEHTRLAGIAQRWVDRGRPPELLLRGSDLAEAEHWSITRPPKAPDPTDLHREFITRGRDAEARGLRRTRMALGALAAASLLAVGIIGWLGLQAHNNAEQARAGWGLALDISTRMGGEVADRLSTTHGVPPDAVARVLSKARTAIATILERHAGTSGPEADRQRLLDIDIRIRAAAAGLASGDDAAAREGLGSAKTELARVCSSEPGRAECELRRAHVESVEADLLLASIESRPEELEALRKAEDDRAGRLAAALEAAGSSPLREPLLVARARARAIAVESLLQRNSTNNAAVSDAASLAKSCIDELQPARSVPPLPTVELALATCLRLRALALAESGAAVDRRQITALLTEAQGAIATVQKDDPDNLTARFAAVATSFVLARHGAAVPDSGAFDKARSELQDLIAQNGRNVQFQTAYLRETSALLDKGQRLLGGDALLSALERRADYLLARVQDERLSETGRANRRSELFLTLETLYDLHASAGNNTVVAAIHRRFAPTFERLRDIIASRADQRGLKAGLFALHRAALSERAAGREAIAVGHFLLLSAMTRDAALAALGLADDKVDESGDVIIYAWSAAARGLGDLNADAIPDLAELDRLLEQAHDQVLVAKKSDEGNYEFRKAYADILSAQARRVEKDNRAKAFELYRNAADLGSDRAINQLKNWVLSGFSQQVGDTSTAEVYERRRREVQAVQEKVRATSRILDGVKDYDVYLMPERSGEDNIQSEFKRLRRYYRVKDLVPPSETRLLDIVSMAKLMTRNFGTYTQRHLLPAVAERRRRDEIEMRFPEGAPGAATMAEADRAMVDRQFGQALGLLERVRVEVSKADAGAERILLLSRLAFQQVKVANTAAADMQADARLRVQQAQEEVDRQLSDAVQKFEAEIRRGIPQLRSNLNLPRTLSELAERARVRPSLERSNYQQWSRLHLSLVQHSIRLGEAFLATATTSASIIEDVENAQIELAEAWKLQFRFAEALTALEAANTFASQRLVRSPASAAIKLRLIELRNKRAFVLLKLEDTVGAARLSAEALKMAKDLAGQDAYDLGALIAAAEANETMALLTEREIDNKRKEVQALFNETSGQTKQFIAQLLHDLTRQFGLAEGFYSNANDYRIKVLRIDPARDCACHVAANIDRTVDLISQRVKLQALRAKLLSNPEPVDELKQVEGYLDGRISTWRDTIRAINPKALTGAASGDFRSISDDEAVFHSYVASAVLRKARHRILLLATGGQSGQTLKGVFKEAVPGFVDATQEQYLIYGRFSYETDALYADALGDLIFAYLMAEEPEKADEVARRARLVAETLGHRAIDLQMNRAHSELLNGKIAAALEVYANPAYIDWGQGASKNWRDQLRTDLAQLKLVYAKRAPELDDVLHQVEKAWADIDARAKAR